MIIENRIKDIHPRLDRETVLKMIAQLLDAGDPDDRMDIVVESVLPTGRGA